MISRCLTDLRGTDRDVDSVSVDNDRHGVEASSNFAYVIIRRKNRMRPNFVRPVIVERRHPLGPKILVVKVRAEPVAEFKHNDVGVQIAQPLGAKRAWRSVPIGRTVDEHHEPLTALRRSVNHV